MSHDPSRPWRVGSETFATEYAARIAAAIRRGRGGAVVVERLGPCAAEPDADPDTWHECPTALEALELAKPATERPRARRSTHRARLRRPTLPG